MVADTHDWMMLSSQFGSISFVESSMSAKKLCLRRKEDLRREIAVDMDCDAFPDLALIAPVDSNAIDTSWL